MDIKEYIRTQLNEEQAKAALHTDTSSLIIAGAGSGKTRVLIYKIAYLIRGKKVPINRILAVTFTNKAANEMRERLTKISEEIFEFENGKLSLQDKKIEDAQSSLSTKRIGTFHSIFLKILKEDIERLYSPNPSKIEGDTPPILGGDGGGKKGYTKNFGIFDTNESQSVIKDVLKRMNLQDVYKLPEIKNFISRQKNNGMEAKMYIKQEKSDYDQHMGEIYNEYQKALEKANSLDFDDLLFLPYLLFKKDKEILDKRQNKFDYMLVDEAQDTNRIQFELLKMLSAKNSNITMIGDDFQSIYGRRGALMENFLNVKKYRPDIQMFKLQTNYRSKPHIVQAGNHIIKNNVFQYKKEVVAHRTGDEKITIFSHGTEIDEAANIVEMIKKFKEGNKMKTWGAVAILYRTNAQSSPFEQLFLQEGVPYKIYGAHKFFDRKEIKDIIAYIKYLLNPEDNVSLKRILNVPNRKVGKTTLERLEDYAHTHNISLTAALRQETDAKSGIREFLEVVNATVNVIEKSRPSEVIEFLIKKIKYRDYLIKEEGSEQAADEKYENVGQLINMAEKYTFDSNVGRVTSDEEGKVLDTSNPILGTDLLRSFMEEVALLADISENEEGEIDAVKLMTTHSSKGLEFPIVFVAGLEDHMFPLSNAMMEPKELEEERRLMYVAVTRAKDALFLSYAHSRMTRGQTRNNPPSRFLDEIPIELVKKYDLGGGEGRPGGSEISEGDTVKHKLFGTGYVLEIRNNLAIVKFHNPKFGVRKIECRFLQII